MKNPSDHFLTGRQWLIIKACEIMETVDGPIDASTALTKAARYAVYSGKFREECKAAIYWRKYVNTPVWDRLIKKVENSFRILNE